MPEQDLSNAIAQIKKTHENFMVSLGILIGTILVIYFFTYGALVDSKTSSLIWFEVVTSVMMLFVLIFLRRVCFFLTRLKLGRCEGYAAVFGKLVAADMSLDEKFLLGKLKDGS